MKEQVEKTKEGTGESKFKEKLRHVKTRRNWII